jgi:hypothetical protein
VKKLDRDAAVESPVVGEEHRAHSAFCQLAEELVTTHEHPGRERQPLQGRMQIFQG